MNINDKILYNPNLRLVRGHFLHEKNALKLLRSVKPFIFSGLLNTNVKTIQDLINTPHYREYQIPKKRGGFRTIHAPEKTLKTIQKRLNHYLQAYYLLLKPEEVHGFVINPTYLERKCNIVENARSHVGRKHVFNLDLEDFFTKISTQQVYDVFSSGLFHFEHNMAMAISLLTTFQNALPIGAPTSPVLANFVCLDMDKELSGFCASNTIHYTRYADDLTFSSDQYFEQDQIQKLTDIIARYGFRINEKKRRLQPSNSRQVVTGLTVNQKVNVNRQTLKKVRAMLHDFVSNGIKSATKRHFRLENTPSVQMRERFFLRLEGYINFIGQVRGTSDQVYLRMKNAIQQNPYNP